MPLSNALQGRPLYYGLGIGLAAALLIVGLTHYFLVSGINADIQKNEKELDQLGQKIAAGRAAEKKLPQFREEVRRLELELEKLRRILPSSRNTEEIIQKVKSLVDQGDFVLRKLVFPRLVESSGDEIYSEWPISVTVEGGYHNLAVLFNRLSNFSRIMNVEEITITALARQVERTIVSDFIAKTFVYVEPQEGAKDEEADEKSPKKKRSKKSKKSKPAAEEEG